VGRRVRRAVLRLCAGWLHLRQRQVFLGAGGITRSRRASRRSHRTGEVLGLVRSNLAYSWQWFVDHQYGAWYRILTRDNRKYSDEKSPAGKTDYHTMGACYEVLNVIPE